MKGKYVKDFLLRGMLFGGLGPIILGIIWCIISELGVDLDLDGKKLLLGIASVYLLAFVHAGASVFNQIESWPIAKSSLIHFAVLYVAYVTCSLINSWIPFDWRFVIIFTGAFALIYLMVWVTVVLVLRCVSNDLNRQIKSN